MTKISDVQIGARLPNKVPNVYTFMPNAARRPLACLYTTKGGLDGVFMMATKLFAVIHSLARLPNKVPNVYTFMPNAARRPLACLYTTKGGLDGVSSMAKNQQGKNWIQYMEIAGYRLNQSSVLDFW
jgi:hypothetical protein